MATTLREGLIGPLDRMRGLAGRLGLRGYKIYVLTRLWTGTRVGDGNKIDSSLQLTVAGGAQPCKVVQVSQRDIIRSGGILTDKDLRVGPLTPLYAAGGTSQAMLEPARTSSPTEIFWKATHVSLPNGVAWFDKYGDEVDSLLHYYVTLRANGKIPAP